MESCAGCGISIEHKRKGAKWCSEKCRGEVYRRDNPEVKAKYRRDNKEKIAKSAAKYQKEHLVKGAEKQARYYRDNSEKVAKRNAEYQKDNPEKCRIKSQVYQARKAGLPDNFTSEQWQQKLGEHNYRCSYCYIHQDNLDVPLQQEHIVPVSRDGGYTWDNIVPACKRCNTSKGNKSLLEYLTYKIERSPQ